MALTGSPLVAFIATTDIAKAKTFYGDLLGLELVDETPVALVFDVAGTTLRITPVAEVQPAPYAVLGWTVDDITSAVADLKARGVTLSRYEGVGQDDDGIWMSPSRARIA